MSEAKINMRALEATAKIKAREHIITMFQRPGQLEKVEQNRRRLSRKKGSLEAHLKSAMQKGLDDVRNGLNKLHTCLQDVSDIDESMKKMFVLFADVPELCNKLNEVRDVNMRHSQYLIAKENLKHIITVPESVEKTKQWINEGKLLHTHQCLRDLENSRDDLLYELHKLPNQSPHDISTLKAYLADVEVLSNMLKTQLRLILSRTLNTVRKEPTIIVTALRIIEREEKSDTEALKQGKQTGFVPPGRPKQWKAMAFDVLEKAVATRIEGTQIEERKDNKHWLIIYLELTRQLILEDLRVVKTLCVPCFPPSYNIIDKYIHMYHNCLSNHLQSIIQNGLEETEYVSILSWTLKTYKSEELLGHPDLIEYTKNLDQLLPPAISEKLESEYLANMVNNYNEWMQNTLISEKQEWTSSEEPSNSYARTAAPVIIFDMIGQNLEVAKTISDDLTLKALNLSIDQVIKYGTSYREGIVEFKNKYFDDRKQVPYYAQYMISIINNCSQLAELGNQLEKQYSGPSFPVQLTQSFQKLRTTFWKLRNDCGDYLLEEVFVDLDKDFAELFTSRWLSTTVHVDTIKATLDDYFQDYNRLVKNNYNFVLHLARSLVSRRYLTAMLSKKVSFKTYEECTQAAAKVVREANQLKGVFLVPCPDLEGEDPFESIITMAEVLKSDDDMLSFELHRALEKYPDITEDHLLRLLNLRGDLSKADIKDKVLHLPRPETAYQSSIFKTLVFPKLVNLNVFQ